MEQLPFIDQHTLRVGAPADAVWSALLGVLRRTTKPRIFLGSSGKQEPLLAAIARGLEEVAEVVPWTTSFNPGTTTLERLLERWKSIRGA